MKFPYTIIIMYSLLLAAQPNQTYGMVINEQLLHPIHVNQQKKKPIHINPINISAITIAAACATYMFTHNKKLTSIITIIGLCTTGTAIYTKKHKKQPEKQRRINAAKEQTKIDNAAEFQKQIAQAEKERLQIEASRNLTEQEKTTLINARITRFLDIELLKNNAHKILEQTEGYLAPQLTGPSELVTKPRENQTQEKVSLFLDIRQHMINIEKLLTTGLGLSCDIITAKNAILQAQDKIFFIKEKEIQERVQREEAQVRERVQQEEAQLKSQQKKAERKKETQRQLIELLPESQRNACLREIAYKEEQQRVEAIEKIRLEQLLYYHSRH